ncbi:MAG: glycosyltransferase family 4 protein [Cellulomonadaceae bacterium]|nr:glycosyltransferase family 4 protein [Cellulomonadaceae bacterium]
MGLTVEQCWHQVPGGSGSYVVELVRALGSLDGLTTVGLSARHTDAAPVEDLGLAVASSALPRTVLYESWNRLRRPRAESLAGAVDVVHATTWAVPGTRAPLVVTVHDLAFLRSPEHFTARGNAYFRRALQVVRDEADAIVVPSRASLTDCVEAGLPPERIHVVPHGVRAHPVTSDQVADWRRRYDIARPYLLWCGTLEPRKNLIRLVEAYEIATAEGGLDLDLVLAGPVGWGGVSEALERALARLPPGAVRRVGRLSDDDLQVAYAGARLFAFPSLWEGFGMPVLEAMAHGVPVVTSSGTSMAEFVGASGVVVEPTDVHAIAAGLVEVAGDAHDVMSMAARRAGELATWQASARAHHRVYNLAAGRIAAETAE